MSSEDTKKIVAAIDRNTEAFREHSRRTERDELFRIPVLASIATSLIMMACCPPAKAAPVTHMTISGPLQYWHTQWVTMDGGVYPLEVYAPALPKVEPELYMFVDIGDPPRLTETPEPGTWVLTGMSFGCLIGYVVITRRLQHKVKRYRKALNRIADHGCHELSREMAREALEE